MASYAQDIESAGHEVVSSWIYTDDHPEITSLELAAAAHVDLCDLQRCELFVAFTEPTPTECSSGARHVELGFAMAVGKAIAIVGPRENIYCHLPSAAHFESWDVFIGHLSRRAA